MYIATNNADQILNTDFVERFCVVSKSDAVLIVASYSADRYTTIGRYKDIEEARTVCVAIYQALEEGRQGFTMPDSKYYFEEHIKKDARTKRKGGS